VNEAVLLDAARFTASTCARRPKRRRIFGERSGFARRGSVHGVDGRAAAKTAPYFW
jgi:hypothetical protein